jgi:thioredoxin-like negative regulator of GroEL
MPLPVITEIRDREHFIQIIKSNPGVIIMKFGAKWCGPCKQIEPFINEAFARMPDTVQCMNIDVDQYTDVYAFLKSKRIVNGIPVVLAYTKNNTGIIPDDIVIGADLKGLRNFFIKYIDMN